MDWIFWYLLVIVLFAISLKQVKLHPWNYYLHLLAFALLVQIGLLLPYFYFPFRPFDYRNANASAKVAIHLGKLLGVRYKLTGAKELRKGGGIVLINHQSFLDLIVLGYIWHHLGPAAVISKKEILYIPPIGVSIWSYGSILVDRSNPKAARRSIEKASEAIHQEGKKLIFFPEGTRSVSDSLLPFKNGAFISAHDNKCKVFPVVVSKFFFLDHVKKLFSPGEGFINILEPVDSTKFATFKELRDHCQLIMQEEYDRLNGLRKE